MIYGSPVPGYRAPTDTVGPAVRIPVLLGGIPRDVFADRGTATAPVGAPLAGPLRAEVAAVGDVVASGVVESVPPGGSCRGSTSSGGSFELFGQLNNTIEERRALFDYQVRELAGLLGIAT